MFNVICKIAVYRIGALVESVRKLAIRISALIELALPYIIGALVMLAIYGIMFLMLIGFGYAY